MASVVIRQLVRRMYTRPSCPMAIVGPPGSGKTAQAVEAGKELGYPVRIFIASTCDETDIAGMPVYQNNSTVVITPEWGLDFQRQPGLLILDEFNCARTEVLNAMLTLIQDRTFPNGRDRLHPETIILALMNDASMVGNEELSPAMNNRFGWIDMGQPLVKDHIRWFTTGSLEETNKKQKGYGRPKTKPVTLEAWREWLWESEENGADLKELYKEAHNCGLCFASDDLFQTSRRVCTPRTVEKLMYFSGTADVVSKYADYFLDEKNASIFKTAFHKQKHAAPNVGLNSRRGKTDAIDPEDRLQNASEVDRKIKQQLGVGKFFDHSETNEDVVE